MRSNDLSSTTRLVLYEDIGWVLDSCWVAEKTIHLVFAGFNMLSLNRKRIRHELFIKRTVFLGKGTGTEFFCKILENCFRHLIVLEDL